MNNNHTNNMDPNPRGSRFSQQGYGSFNPGVPSHNVGAGGHVTGHPSAPSNFISSLGSTGGRSHIDYGRIGQAGRGHHWSAPPFASIQASYGYPGAAPWSFYGHVGGPPYSPHGATLGPNGLNALSPFGNLPADGQNLNPEEAMLKGFRDLLDRHVPPLVRDSESSTNFKSNNMHNVCFALTSDGHFKSLMDEARDKGTAGTRVNNFVYDVKLSKEEVEDEIRAFHPQLLNLWKKVGFVKIAEQLCQKLQKVAEFKAPDPSCLTVEDIKLLDRRLSWDVTSCEGIAEHFNLSSFYNIMSLPASPEHAVLDALTTLFSKRLKGRSLLSTTVTAKINDKTVDPSFSTTEVYTNRNFTEYSKKLNLCVILDQFGGSGGNGEGFKPNSNKSDPASCWAKRPDNLPPCSFPYGLIHDRIDETAPYRDDGATDASAVLSLHATPFATNRTCRPGNESLSPLRQHFAPGDRSATRRQHLDRDDGSSLSFSQSSRGEASTNDHSFVGTQCKANDIECASTVAEPLDGDFGRGRKRVPSNEGGSAKRFRNDNSGVF